MKGGTKARKQVCHGFGVGLFTDMTTGYGGKCPHFCQDSASDFFKINEKIIGGSSKSSEK